MIEKTTVILIVLAAIVFIGRKVQRTLTADQPGCCTSGGCDGHCPNSGSCASAAAPPVGEGRDG